MAPWTRPAFSPYCPGSIRPASTSGRHRGEIMRKLAVLLALVLAGVTTTVRAQDYPTRPIRLIVPFAAGGAADATARILGKKVGDALGQTFVIENRGGGNGGIGTEVVKSADPDGYTLLLGQSGPISINPGIYPKLALRSGEGPGADLHDHGLSLYPRGQSLARREDGGRAGGAGEEQAGRAELRHHRRRAAPTISSPSCLPTRPGSR